MKIYFINNDDANSNMILNELEKSDVAPVVEKKEYSFRTTKNDLVIVSGFRNKNEKNESLKKYNNLIVISESKDEETIFYLANEFNAKDVIYSLQKPEYISQRITKYISQNME